MVPRVMGRMRVVVPSFFFFIAIYAAVYGVTYVYMLHHLVNMAVVMLVILHMTGGTWSISRAGEVLNGTAEPERRKRGKTP